MIALVLDGFLGPITVVVAVLLGGSALRVMDRFEARNLPARRRRGNGSLSSGCFRSLTPFEWIALGQTRWTDEYEAHIKERLDR